MSNKLEFGDFVSVKLDIEKYRTLPLGRCIYIRDAGSSPINLMALVVSENGGLVELYRGDLTLIEPASKQPEAPPGYEIVKDVIYLRDVQSDWMWQDRYGAWKFLSEAPLTADGQTGFAIGVGCASGALARPIPKPVEPVTMTIPKGDARMFLQGMGFDVAQDYEVIVRGFKK